MSIQTILAIWAGKKTAWLSQVFGLGKGSSAPGMMALKFEPQIISILSSQIKKKKIIISATNGKTTTSKMIAHIFAKNGMSFVRNSMGANLDRGIASALIEKTSWMGELRADYGIFEVDEAYLPDMVKQIKPDIVVLGNLFRDQLDRYGEIETILKKWRDTLCNTVRGQSPRTKKLDSSHLRSNNIQIILNADDPTVASLGENLPNVIYYGIKEYQKEKDVKIEHAADSVRCVKCGNNLDYKSKYFSHLGDYVCLKCGYIRLKLDYWAQDIQTSSYNLKLITYNSRENAQIKMQLPGIYNVYNVLAAQTVADICGIDLKKSALLVADFKPAFGRMEQFTYNERNFTISLIKNPTGANAVIQTFKNEKNKNIIIALNDKIADGTDVSWIYDADFEKLSHEFLHHESSQKNHEIKNIICAGTRKYDMALRLKYANILSEIAQGNYMQILDDMINKTKKGEHIYILPTYTAMLELRKELEKMRIVNKL